MTQYWTEPPRQRLHGPHYNTATVRRLAWFTPLPPVRSGISQYSAELLPELAGSYDIDIFIDGQPRDVECPAPGLTVRSAHDFVWRHMLRPYDLVVYQLGNAVYHDYMWAYFARYPGLVVLHDGQLHQARGRRLRDRQRYDDYQDEFAYNHPGVDNAVIDLAIRGRLGDLAHFWPMRRVAIESARLVAVHNAFLAEEIRNEIPGAAVEVVDMGVPAPTPSPDAGSRIRARHGIPAGAVVFLALGAVTPEKRIAQVVRQLAAVSQHAPQVFLLLAGQSAGHYDAAADLREAGVADRAVIAGFIEHDEIADYLEAADVCLCLRWPTSRENSAAWLRCLAAGRPTVVTDLAHMTDISSYDPRSWTALYTPAATRDADGWPLPQEPSCVSVDLMDEEHSLHLAMQRLATDARLRSRLSRRAHELWQERFTLDGMAARYRALIEQAIAAPMPGAAALAGLPAHFRTDGTEGASARLREAGLTEAAIAAVWAVPTRPR